MGKLYYQDKVAKLYNSDCRAMSDLPDETVQMVVTSPPYWGLRKYSGLPDLIWGGDGGCEHKWIETITNREYHQTGATGRGSPTTTIHKAVSQNSFCSLCSAWKGQLGLEPTPEMYISHLVEIFREVRRVLRSDGVVFLNIGDSYSGGHRKSNPNQGFDRAKDTGHAIDYTPSRDLYHDFIKPKDLCLIPFRLAIALQEDSWYVRSVIIWSKPNPMPESVRDRPSESHEYILMLTKSARYYYDQEAVREVAEVTANMVEYSNEHKDLPNLFTGIAPDGVLPSAEPPFSQFNLQGLRQEESNSLEKNGNGGSEIQASLRAVATQRQREGNDCQIRPLGEETGTVKGIPSESCGEGITKENKPITKRESTPNQVLSITERQRGDKAQTYQEEVNAASRDDPDGRRVAGNNKETEESLFLLSTNNGTPDTRPSDSSHFRGATQSQEYSGSMPFLQCKEKQSSSSSIRSRNLRSVWTFSTQPYKFAHFATYPEELVRRCVLAATPEVGCCSKCGKPWVRIIEKQRAIPQREKWRSQLDANGRSDYSEAGGWYDAETQTLGWKPTCKCGLDQSQNVPSIVLDPFVGSGTTFAVAKRLGRYAVGYELSEKYCALAIKRIEKETAPMSMS